MYPDSAKMKKQMSYANDKHIPYVALAGENEINEGKITLKNMSTGEQTMVTMEELVDHID
jgi:histidyl-tRNA synthetase